MNNQTINNSAGNHKLPITPNRIALIRLWYDLFIVIVTFIFLRPILDNKISWIVIGSTLVMFTGSTLGYFIIQQGQKMIGMGFVIYSFLLGLTTISIFVEGLGPFVIVTMILVTTLSVSYAIPGRRIIEAVSASFVLGVFNLVFDLRFRGAEFRLAAPQHLTSIFWLITFVLVAVIFYFIARQFTSFTLQAKMITSFTAITILALSILGFLNSRSVQTVLTEEANQSLYNAAAQTADSLQQFINSNFQSINTEAHLPILVNFLSSSESERESLRSETNATLYALAEKDPLYIASYGLLDLEGNVVADTQPEHISENEFMLSAFTEALQRENLMISPVEIDPFTSEPSIYFSAPIYNNDAPIGVLRVRYSAEILQSIISKSNNRGGNDSFAVLFDENLIHLAHGIAPETIFQTVAPLDTLIFEKLIEDRRLPIQTADETFLNLPDLEENLKSAQNSPNGVVYFEATDIATGDRLNQVVVINMVEPPWLLAFFQPQEIYLSPIETLADNTILLGLLSGLGAVVLGIGLTQILTKPIMSLTDTAEKVSQGNFDARVEITTEDEIGKLGKTFNTMTVQLQNLINNLEDQVEMRTKSLRNQAAQLRASAEIARDVTSEQYLQDLLDRASNLILNRFGFYHVGIYLNDAKNEYTILTSSTDQPGQRLIQADHRTKIDSESNIGYACVLGEPIIATIADDTPPLSFHPLLPSSQSELILPLKVGNEILGAIDIHSTNPTSFSDEDVNIFQILADQIAIGIQKALYQKEIQQTLNELEAAYGTFTKESWQKFVHSRETTAGYKFNQTKIEVIETPSPEVIQAWEKGDKVVSQKKSSNPNEQDSSILAIPMKVRGEVVGVLNIEFESTQIPMDTTELITEIADRLGLILENARLIETAQKQVEREQLTSHISNSIRQSLDMELVLQTAVQEIGKNLGLSEVELRLGSANQSKISTQQKPNGKQDTDAMRNG